METSVSAYPPGGKPWPRQYFSDAQTMGYASVMTDDGLYLYVKAKIPGV
ncbi:hypothetical protein [Bacillus sonorensis]|nr:hypothetical protein CHCC20335_2588 [Bacillus paralicheniformis]